MPKKENRTSSVNLPFRATPEFHKELKTFLLHLAVAKGEEVSIQSYVLKAVKEKMERDKVKYNITFPVNE